MINFSLPRRLAAQQRRWHLLVSAALALGLLVGIRLQAAEPQSLTLLHTMRQGDSVGTLAFTPNGKTLASGGGEWATRSAVVLWDVQTGRARHRLLDKSEDWNVSSVAFSPSGQTVAVACDAQVLLWDRRTGRLLRRLQGGLVGEIMFSPDGKMLVSGSGQFEDGSASDIQRWELPSGRRMPSPQRSNSVFDVAFDPSGRFVFGVDGGETPPGRPYLRKWGTTGRQLHSRALPPGTFALAFSHDAKRLLTGRDGDGINHRLSFWDTGSGRMIKTLADGAVGTFAFSPDGRWIVSGGETDGRHALLRLWDAHTGRLLQVSRAHHGNIQALAFSPGGKLLATGSDDGAIMLWRMP